jgi:tRNA A-37 threonylcarbamoyl transferase component Bud32/tetratricopeptide (TPR) repeat protein
MPLSVGDKLGPYEILAPIGAGGMGEVYKARDTRLDRIVAIKQLKALHSGRFEQEARAIAALNHPHICQIYDVGTDYLVMEYVEGTPLHGPFPAETAMKLALEIVGALEEAHARGILHRDLKPGNILVTAKGSGKLIDFGLAKLTAEFDNDATRTLEGAVIGTAAYMSPEQAQGQAVDERSDIFSFGAVLYEMLSGERAFPGNSRATVLSAVLRDDPLPFQAPAGLQYIVGKCLAKRAQDRFSSMSELRLALQEISHNRADAPPPGLFPIAAASRMTVGREAQRGQLWRAYGHVKEGRGLIVAITGEAGIGKTSLLEEFLADLATRGEHPVLARGRCSERLAGAEAYLPILEAFESLLHSHAMPWIAGTMKALAPTWYTLVAGNSPETTGSAAQREAAPAASQERMKREFGALCQELSRKQPLVFFVEDLHWADISTVDMFNYLAGHFAQLRVLVLETHRPSDMALAGNPFLAIRRDLQSRGLFEEIGLGFLDLQDVERYLLLQFPGHQFPADFAAVIHAKTEGSPLFMADLVRYLRDTGGIVEEDGRWALARSLPEGPRDLPESVRGMIQRKIEQVDDTDRKLLVAASVQGHEFDSSVVAEAMEMDAADVEERLETLERVYVFVKRGEEREFPDRSLTLNYQFVHVLYQNLLYASLQPTRRAALSGRVARALVARYGDQVAAVAGRVAVLFETSRDFSSAAKHFHMAARRSVGLFAFGEALSLAERGLRAVAALPDDLARKQQELELQMMKGVALRSKTGWATPEIERVFTRARQLCQELNDPPQLIPVLWATTLFLLIRGNLRECRDRAGELLAQAERSGEQAYLMAANHLSGVVREFMGDMVEASRFLERCRELHHPSQHLVYAAMYGQDPGMAARAMSSRPLWALGYPDRALARAGETLTIARGERQPVTLSFSLVVIQGIHVYRGEAAEAMAAGEEIDALCREYQLPQEALWNQAFQGYAMHLLGRTNEGIDLLKASLAAQQALSAGLVRPAFLALLADALRHAGRVEEGLEAADEGFAHAERTCERGYVAELYRVRGELLRVAGDAALAEASLREALDYAGRQQARSFELRAATALARLLQAGKRQDEARAVLAPIYDWFTEGHDTADLAAARTLLSEIG